LVQPNAPRCSAKTAADWGVSGLCFIARPSDHRAKAETMHAADIFILEAVSLRRIKTAISEYSIKVIKWM